MLVATLVKQDAVSRRVELRRAVIGFSLSSLALLMAAPLLAWSAERAITTSLPELVVAIAAVRLGAFDLAVGNLFGGNAFNMAAFLFADLAYCDGGLLDCVSSTHALTAL